MDGWTNLYEYYDYEDKLIEQRLQETQTDERTDSIDQD